MTKLANSLTSVIGSFDYYQDIPLETNISLDPQTFYADFGYLQHPFSRQPVTSLASYQAETWQALLDHGKVLCLKSQKVGLSTSFLLADFMFCLLPTSHPRSAKGRDVLIIGQTKAHGIEHVRTLRKLILDSPKYGKYLIQRAIADEDDILSKIQSERSKDAVLYIRNSENEQRPSRIIALGLDNSGSLASWKNIGHIHISDCAFSIGDYSDAISVAMSRLANTQGSMVIESPCGPPRYKLYEMWRDSRIKDNYPFKTFQITYEDAIKEGIMSQAFIDQQRQELTPEQFNAMYNAEFLLSSGSVFSKASINHALSLKYNPAEFSQSLNVMGIDPGFGSSAFGIAIARAANRRAEILLADSFVRPDYDEMINKIAELIRIYKIEKVFIDAANPEVIRSIKFIIGERTDYENLTEFQKGCQRITGIAFGGSQGGKSLLSNFKMLCDRHYLAIDPSFAKLIEAMKSAVNKEGRIDKSLTLNHDVLDACMLACSNYSVRGVNPNE